MVSPLPHTKRRAVFDALFTLIKTIGVPSELGSKWKYTSQHLKIWDDVPAQPALFLYRGPQLSEQKHSYGVTKWVWRASIWVYYRTDSLNCAGNDEFPEQLVDDLIDSIEQTFQTEPLEGPLTLGGLVHHCFIDGSIFFDSGVVDNQAVLVVPITILI